MQLFILIYIHPNQSQFLLILKNQLHTRVAIGETLFLFAMHLLTQLPTERPKMSENWNNQFLKASIKKNVHLVSFSILLSAGRLCRKQSITLVGCQNIIVTMRVFPLCKSIFPFFEGK